MTQEDPDRASVYSLMPRQTIEMLSFVAVVVLVTMAFIWVVLPLYGAVLWAVILAILFNPLQQRLVRRFGGRRNLAAAASLLACICIVVLPGSLLLTALAQETTGLYDRISERDFDLASVLREVRAILPSFLAGGMADFGSAEEIEAGVAALLGQAAQAIAARAVIIGQNTAQFLISLGVMLYVLFFLFRDGGRLAVTIRNASPLEKSHTDHILRKFAEVVKATVRGNVIIAGIQGTIGGVAFWLLGIQAALLWGALMGVLSLLPAIGSFLIWGPAAVWLLLSGQYLKGAVLLAIGVLVISTIDNLLRPRLVGMGTRLPDYVVLVSTLGGLALLGMNGFVIGPLVAALFVAVWSLFRNDQTPS